MRKITLLSISAFLLIAVACHYSKDRTQPAPSFSGAYEALNAFAAQRTYPFDKLPDHAHYAAWETAKSMATPRSTTEPWESMGPHNFSGRTLTLAFNPLNPNTLYAGSASGGLWRSHSAGLGAEAWEYVPTGYPVLAVSSIAFAPADSNVMYIGTGEVYNYDAAGTGAAYRNTRGSYGIGILKSTDGGQSWSKSLDWSYAQNRGIWMIRVHPFDPDILFAATTEGTYKSTDAGENWIKILSIRMATDLLINPLNPDQVIVACGNFGSPGHGIYKSSNSGQDWFKISSGLPATFDGKVMLGMAPSQPNTIYASIGNGFAVGSSDNASWLCRSDDFGNTWAIRTTQDYSQHQGWFSHDVDVSPVDPDEMIVVGIAVWKSIDGGLTIERKTRDGLGYNYPPIEGPDGWPDFVHSDCHYVLYHPVDPSIFYVANDGGIHRSEDGGTTYRSCNGGMQTIQFYNGFSNSYQDSTFCIGGLQDNGSIYWHGDLTWERIWGGDGSWSAIKPSNDSTIYVSSQNLNMWRLFDKGFEVDHAAPSIGAEPVSFIAPYLIAPTDDNQLYAGATKVYRSLDGGDNWLAINTEQPLDGHPILSMAVSSQSTDVLYAATTPFDGERSGVFITKDGNLFSDITANLPDRFPMDMAVDPTDDATAYITFSGYGTGHVFVTYNYGESWADITNNLPDVPTNAVVVDPLFPSNIYIGNDLGVFASIDGGQNWMPYQDGLFEAVMVFDLTIAPVNRKLRAATHGNGAFQRDLLESDFVGVSQPLNNIADIQISPNPNSGTATLRYRLKSAEDVSIQLLDQNGRLLKTLLNYRLAAGEHVEPLNLDNLTPGTYYVRMNTKGGVLSKKVLLVR